MIPVFEPSIGEEEIEAVVAAIRRGEISGSFGSTIEQFEEEFAHYVGAAYGVAVSSGTTALHVAVAAAGLGPGDEILVSASTIDSISERVPARLLRTPHKRCDTSTDLRSRLT